MLIQFANKIFENWKMSNEVSFDPAERQAAHTSCQRSVTTLFQSTSLDFTVSCLDLLAGYQQSHDSFVWRRASSQTPRIILRFGVADSSSERSVFLMIEGVLLSNEVMMVIRPISTSHPTLSSTFNQCVFMSTIATEEGETCFVDLRWTRNTPLTSPSSLRHEVNEFGIRFPAYLQADREQKTYLPADTKKIAQRLHAMIVP